MTTAEKILSRAADKEAHQGDTVVARVDRLMSHEGFRVVGRVLEETGIRRLWDPERVVIVLDHNVPAPDEATAEAHAYIRGMVEKFGISRFYDVRGGISHQVMVEKGHVLPGELIVGTDSHSTMYGALGAAGTGIGFTEGAYVCATGTLWFSVPETICYWLRGQLSPGVLSKDILLYLAGRFGVEGAAHKAIEWRGEGANALSAEARMTMANMTVEMGGKFGFFEPDEKTFAYLEEHGAPRGSYQPLFSDDDAHYSESHEIDLAGLEPRWPCRIRPITCGPSRS